VDFETTFRAVLWRWDARQADSWFFVSLPEDESELLRELPRPPRGFGSIRVEVRIGSSRWATSIFPASSGVYVLPIKAAVRRKEELEEDDEVEVSVRVV
jgi:hypothetical protein